MQLRTYTGSLTRLGIIIGLIVFALLFIAIWVIVDVAFGADVDCMSKDQARARYPKQVIYWHTAHRCWDNIPVRGKTSKLPSQDGNGNGLHKSTPRPASPPATMVRPASSPAIFYPSLMPGAGTDGSMLRPDNASTWMPIADFDEMPPPFIPWQRRISLNTHGE